jgi:hypothetical protein
MSQEDDSSEGKSMAVAIREVGEAEAQGKIKSIYEDIKATLRMPLVDVLFRTLAAYPWYLELAWRNLKPNVSIRYFERSADELRTTAAEFAASALESAKAARESSLLAGLSDTEQAAVRQTVAMFHYSDPKLLLATGALRAGINGQLPKTRLLSMEDKRPIPTGIPANIGEIATVNVETAPPEVRSIFADMERTLAAPVITTDYRALARWPSVLQAAWSFLKPFATSPDFREGEQLLASQAREAVEALPFRMEISATAARQAGLSEAEIDEVRRLLNEFWALLPGIALTLAALDVVLEGADRARRSPFPV